MKPFYIFLFVLTLFIFGIIFYAIQSQNISSQKSALDIINQISPTPAMYLITPQAAQGQQPQQGQQSQEQQLQQQIEQVKKASITATLKTSKGDIEMELYG